MFGRKTKKSSPRPKPQPPLPSEDPNLKHKGSFRAMESSIRRSPFMVATISALVVAVAISWLVFGPSTNGFNLWPTPIVVVSGEATEPPTREDTPSPQPATSTTPATLVPPTLTPLPTG